MTFYLASPRLMYKALALIPRLSAILSEFGLDGTAMAIPSGPHASHDLAYLSSLSVQLSKVAEFAGESVTVGTKIELESLLSSLTSLTTLEITLDNVVSEPQWNALSSLSTRLVTKLRLSFVGSTASRLGEILRRFPQLENLDLKIPRFTTLEYCFPSTIRRLACLMNPDTRQSLLRVLADPAQLPDLQDVPKVNLVGAAFFPDVKQIGLREVEAAIKGIRARKHIFEAKDAIENLYALMEDRCRTR